MDKYGGEDLLIRGVEQKDIRKLERIMSNESIAIIANVPS